MPASTPFLGLYKPGGGSTGLITPDEVVDIDRLNTNSDLIDAFAKSYGSATERNHSFYGPAALRSSVTGMKRGDMYQESDASNKEWRFNGAKWILWNAAPVLVTAFGSGWSSPAAEPRRLRVGVIDGRGYTAGSVDTAASGAPEDNFIFGLPDTDMVPTATIAGIVIGAGIPPTASTFMIAFYLQTGSSPNPGRVQVETRSTATPNSTSIRLGNCSWPMDFPV